MEPEAVVAIEEQARSEARGAYQTYLAVLTPVEGIDKHFKGVALARTIWTALDRGLNEALDASLATLAGFRLAEMLADAPELQTPDFVDLASAYIAAFAPEFRRIHRAMRTPGPEKDPMFAYLMADDGGPLRPWAKAFASAEAPSGWERSVQAVRGRGEQPPHFARRLGEHRLVRRHARGDAAGDEVADGEKPRLLQLTVGPSARAASARSTHPMKHTLVRLAASGAAVCLATWLSLLAAGNTGLQRSISWGAVTLFEHPLAVALVIATGFGVAYVCAARVGVRPLPLVAAVLLGDAFAGLILAPVLIGELEPIHAPGVFAAVSVLGVQPAAALAGAAVARIRSRDIARR